MIRRTSDGIDHQVRLLAASAVMLAILGTSVLAQTASFKGLVLTDSTERPIADVTVSIDQLKLHATTDSLGRFTINGIEPGAYVVSAKRIGFGPMSTRVVFNRGATVEADFLLTPGVQALPEVNVEARAAPRHGKLAEFEERRLAGAGGRFLTQLDLEKRPFATVVNALRQLPGIDFQRNRDRNNEMYAVAGRFSQPAGAMASGSLQPCFAAVVLDGIVVYGAGEANEPKFNLNNIDPKILAGIEFYVGPATIPARYNGLRHTCGLLVLWTK